MANTYTVAGSDPNIGGVYQQEWSAKLQERLDKPTNWKEVCEVIYSDSKYLNVPYMSTESVIQTGTRGTAYGFSDYTLTNDQLSISTYKPVPMFVDRADLAQCKLLTQMDMAERQGKIIDEHLEAAFLADHANWTNFGDTGEGVLGLASTAIAVTTSNIRNIVSGVKREILTANGGDLADANGIAFVWRPADFEKLELVLQGMGFNLSDQVLRNGIMTTKGYYALGAYHYVSNSHTSGHVFAGVRRVETVGILRVTYGQIVVTQDPNLQSGVGVISRVDYGLNVKQGQASLVFDVNVV